MTQNGKCDTCRSRKVKCDEERPLCGQCKKKNRPCAYDYSKTPRFRKVRTDASGIRCTDLVRHPAQGERPVCKNADPRLLPSKTTLAIRSVKEAKLGSGVFYTFRTVSKPGNSSEERCASERGLPNAANATVSRPLSSRETRICAGFWDLLGENGANWNPSFVWGCWISTVPLMLGKNPALDDAADCFLSADAAYHNKRKLCDADASKRYNAALVSLQKVLDADDSMKFETETLAAVNILLLFEEVLAFRERRWEAHYKGLLQMLLARGPQPKADHMSRSLFYAALNHDFSEAILEGRLSRFDTPQWLDLPGPEYLDTEREDFTCISTEMARHMIKLPRLVTLVRQVRRNAADVDAGIEALALAEHLYCQYLQVVTPKAEAAVKRCTSWVDTLDADLARFYPKSLDFRWHNVFEGLVRCQWVRILICALCVSLRSLFPLSPILAGADLEAEGIRCAELIAMSTHYAEKQRPFTLGALVMRLPLQMAYGTWWRREVYGSASDSERVKAKAMKEWCARKTNAFVDTLDADAISEEELQTMYVAVAEGGPLDAGKQTGPLV